MITALVDLLLSLLWPVLPAITRARISAKRRYEAERARKLREFEQQRRQIEKEARLFRRICTETLARMGFVNESSETNKRRAKRVTVKFEYTRYNEYAIYLKVWVRSQKLFRAKSELPDRALVSKLSDDDTLHELSYAVQRLVRAKRDDPTKGLWYIIYRNEAAGLLPGLVRYSNIVKLYPADMGYQPRFILGIGENNRAQEIDLDTYPHILIAGAANSGKSNLINNFIASQIRFCTPEQIAFILIDPKRVEFVYYEDIPHLARIEDKEGPLPPIIEESALAIRALAYANRLIDKRTDMIKGVRAKKLSEYNARFPDKPLARLVIIIDEVASLWDSAKSRAHVHTLLERIGNMGRAMGVHLILGTQVPTKEVIPTRLKANLWVRISGKMPDTTSSIIIIGTGDAAWIEDVKGRMMFSVDVEKHEFQAPLITNEDIDEAVHIARGKHAGLIRTQALTVIPVRETLLQKIAEIGDLRVRALHHQLKHYALTQAMIEPFVNEIRAAGELRLGDQLFVVKGDSLVEKRDEPLLLPMPALPDPAQKLVENMRRWEYPISAIAPVPGDPLAAGLSDAVTRITGIAQLNGKIAGMHIALVGSTRSPQLEVARLVLLDKGANNVYTLLLEDIA